MVHHAGLADDLLIGAVGRGAWNLTAARVKLGLPTLSAETGDTEVDDLDQLSSSGVHEHHVGGLQVPVKDASTVSFLQRPADPLGDA